MHTRFLFLLVCLSAFSFSHAQSRGYTVSNVHSHNDYEQKIPFRMAYNAGFGSMEADLLLMDSVLFVAHDSSELPRKMKMDTAYLIPLLDRLKRSNGYPYEDREKKLQFIIDIKTAAVPTLNSFISLLKKYPELIRCKAITWVISGNRPDPSRFIDYPDYIRFDGEFNENYSKQALSKISLMSGDFRKYSAWKGEGALPTRDSLLLKSVVDQSHQEHIPLRFWDAPDMPNGWLSLMHLQVDYLNTDHIRAMADFLNSSLSELVSQKPDTFKLKWMPVYMEVSGSGSFGYTTGPWIYNYNAFADSNKSYGAYSSLWIRNKSNQWKLFIDLGVDDSSVFHRSYHDSQKINAIIDPLMDTTKLLAVDAQFDSAFTINREMAYKTFISQDHIMNFPRHALFISADSINTMLKDIPSGLSLVPLRAILSTQKDLGAVYGTVIIGNKRHNYFRIWRSEPVGWRISMETLVY